MDIIIKNILDLKVSFQKDTWASFSKEMRIEDVLNEISNGTYLNKVKYLRKLLELGDNEAYKAEKLKLPAVTFCGTFDKLRKKESLANYNSLIIIDVDNLNNEKLFETINKLKIDEYVYSFWISPSNNGVKGIVPIAYNFEIEDIDIAHKSAFLQLSEYFFEKHNIILDKSGSDTTRLCFMSHDYELIKKNKISAFSVNKVELLEVSKFNENESKKIKLHNTTKRNALFNPLGKNKNTDKRAMKDIITYLSKKRIVITGEYEHRYKIAYAIANTFTFDIGKNFYLDLCKIEHLKYREAKEIYLLEYCYENNAGWTKFKYIEDLVKEEYGFVKKTLEKVVQ